MEAGWARQGTADRWLLGALLGAAATVALEWVDSEVVACTLEVACLAHELRDTIESEILDIQIEIIALAWSV